MNDILAKGPCVECGKLSSRQCRWKDGKLEKDAPFVHICNDCGPQWTIVAEHIKGFGFVGVAEDLEFPKDFVDYD